MYLILHKSHGYFLMLTRAYLFLLFYFDIHLSILRKSQCYFLMLPHQYFFVKMHYILHKSDYYCCPCKIIMQKSFHWNLSLQCALTIPFVICTRHT